jgi:DNA-directed RNA polymerase specialized sigma24 family protein
MNTAIPFSCAPRTSGIPHFLLATWLTAEQHHPVKGVPGTLQEGGAAFPATQWSVVLNALQSNSSHLAQTALTSFCQAYWPPLYTFVRRRGYSPSDAQDLIQAFFAHLLELKTLTRVSRDKGRLRTFLLGSLENFLADQRDHAQALKRGGGKEIVSLDGFLVDAEAALVATASSDTVHEFDRGWAAAVMRRTWEQLQQAYTSEGKHGLFEALKPLVLGGPSAPHNQEEVAKQLNLPPATLRTQLRRLRQRYRELVRDEVAATVSKPGETEEEMQYLYRLLVA